MMIASIFVEAWDLCAAFFSAIGPSTATFFTAIFPLVGLLAAIVILPEVYGYIEVRQPSSSAAPMTRQTPQTSPMRAA